MCTFSRTSPRRDWLIVLMLFGMVAWTGCPSAGGGGGGGSDCAGAGEACSGGGDCCGTLSCVEGTCQSDDAGGGGGDGGTTTPESIEVCEVSNALADCQGNPRLSQAECDEFLVGCLDLPDDDSVICVNAVISGIENALQDCEAG